MYCRSAIGGSAVVVRVAGAAVGGCSMAETAGEGVSEAIVHDTTCAAAHYAQDDADACSA